MTQNPFTSGAQNHTRVNDTLLGSVEKKALLWLAARMPTWVTPDTMTGLGLAAAFLIFISYALTLYHPGFLWLASLGFVIHWFGDSLDGTLARYRKIERPRYGFFVDHMLDSVSEVLIFLGLGLSPYLHFNLAMIGLTSYLLLATYVYLVTYVNGVFRISYARLGPTETRVLAILANTVVFFAGNPILHLHLREALITGPVMALSLTFYDLVTIFFTILVTTFFIYSATTTAMSLSQADRYSAREARKRRALDRKAQRLALREERKARKAAELPAVPPPIPPQD